MTSTESATVTVRGVLRPVVVEGADGERLVHLLEVEERMWRLDGVTGLGDDAPPAGTRVEVTGTVVGPDRIAIEQLAVLDDVLSAAGTTAAPASIRVLAIRAFWSQDPPRTSTRTATRERVIRTSREWFEEVSGGRYAVSGTVTPWLRVPGPPGTCAESFQTLGSQAVDAARRAGYDVESFGRYVVYLPCSAGGTAGVASLNGKYVWLFHNLLRNVVVHEQGHDLGLGHASAWHCDGSDQWATTTWSGSCCVEEARIRFHAGSPTAPGRPRDVTATAVAEGARSRGVVRRPTAGRS